MVNLKLEVRVFPRQQITSQSQFPAVNGSDERSPTDVSPWKEYISFWLPLKDPEGTSFGELCSIITDKWRIVKPDEDPLAIQKLADDAKPWVYLEPDLSVASVFVNEGKARADGYDQYGIVRVIQKPSHRRAQRFGSVIHDWDSTATEARRRLSQKMEVVREHFSPIEEERVSQDVFIKPRHRDLPLSSVEDAAIPETPPFNHQRSDALGGDPSAAPELHPDFVSRKRRQSPESDLPVKEPRLGNLPRAQPALEMSATSAGSPSPARQRRISAFASPQQRRPGVQTSSPVKRGLGIGIAKSPSAMPHPESNQISSHGLPIPSSAPSPSPKSGSVMERSQSLQSSALRQNSFSNKDKHQHVSFTEANISPRRHDAMSTPQNIMKNSSKSSVTPSSSQIVYPSTFSAERIQRMKDDAEKKFGSAKEQHQKDDAVTKIHTEKGRKTKDEAPNKEDPKMKTDQNLASCGQKDGKEARIIQDKLQDLDADSPAREILIKLLNNYDILEKAKAANKSLEKKNCIRRIRRLENKLKHLETASPSPTEHPLPQSASKVTRSIPPTAPATSQDVATTPSGKKKSYAASTPVPSVVIPIASPGKKTPDVNTGPKSYDSPSGKPGPEVILVSSSSSDYATAHQHAGDKQDTDGEASDESENALHGIDSVEQEAQRQVQAEMQLSGSKEYSAEESQDQEAQQQVQIEMQLDSPEDHSTERSGEPSDEHPTNVPGHPVKMYIDDEAESESGSESESDAESGSEPEKQTESESDNSGKEWNPK
ncbi:uncharacterized protein N7477_006197 [Penicillium maclennaniae]|uniref:uncharacterized protein n=1 Tax=Penicillium maclennaniae TaxID=1343394 RepID=UPI00253F7241|nr:uncharacterized protein N7477_006197 [Penicillium maclennaniae]KAJ5670834.1 hypothetical protein N7477_006197 [Penicillium maclennaniae]